MFILKFNVHPLTLRSKGLLQEILIYLLKFEFLDVQSQTSEKAKHCLSGHIGLSPSQSMPRDLSGSRTCVSGVTVYSENKYK